MRAVSHFPLTDVDICDTTKFHTLARILRPINQSETNYSELLQTSLFDNATFENMLNFDSRLKMLALKCNLNV